MGGSGGGEGGGPAVTLPGSPAAGWRMPAFYFVHFFGVGVTLPFLNIYFDAVGMKGVHLGLLNAVPRLTLGFAPPLLGALADKFRRGREVLLVGAAVSVAAALAMWGREGFWPLLVLVTLYSAARGSLVPIAENVCLREIAESGAQYGRVRLWGSLGFIAAALGVGALVDAVSIGAMFPVLAGSSLFLMGVIAFFPREGGEARRRFRGDLMELLRNRPYMILLWTSTLVAFSAGPFSIYFSIYLKELGHPAWVIGMAWTVGVASEIFFFVYAQALQRRVGLKAMITAGMLAYALRWEMITWTESGALLVAIQALHGVAFGVFHAASIQYVDRLSGPATKNTAQSLYSSAEIGLGVTAGGLLASWLLPRWGFPALLHAGALLSLAGAAWFVLALGLRNEEGN
ncbi:MAG: MFS transporter [Candidatus Tectomicrobia bacterium]|nr:MFS transporter [Candidatus Tectomicrobia bacterium]